MCYAFFHFYKRVIGFIYCLNDPVIHIYFRNLLYFNHRSWFKWEQFDCENNENSCSLLFKKCRTNVLQLFYVFNVILICSRTTVFPVFSIEGDPHMCCMVLRKMLFVFKNLRSNLVSKKLILFLDRKYCPWTRGTVGHACLVLKML